MGREDAFQSLDSKVCSCVNTVVLGAEGFGKSNLLSCFFNREYCRRMARQEQILIKRLAYEAGLETQQAADLYRTPARPCGGSGGRREGNSGCRRPRVKRTRTVPSWTPGRWSPLARSKKAES
ncbi:MAG: hypothetical protein HFF59_05745 [Lawsonibacter sp.]|nr:hypothetical protein [Lawsonibacter sp.]